MQIGNENVRNYFHRKKKSIQNFRYNMKRKIKRFHSENPVSTRLESEQKLKPKQNLQNKMTDYKSK